MKICIRNNYTKHRLSVEKEILKALQTGNSGLSDGFSLREIKETVNRNNPGLKTSRTIIREITEDLLISGQAEIVNPDNVTWRLYRIAGNGIKQSARACRNRLELTL